MSNDKESNLDSLLNKSETIAGKKALYKLYEMGCNRFKLGGLLVLLIKKKPIALKYGFEISLRPLDSWDTALNGMSLDELRNIARKAKELHEDIRRLKKTVFVRHLVDEGVLPSSDLLGESTFFAALDRDDPRFWGLLNLYSLTKQIGPKKKPEYTRLLLSIFEHIELKTGKPQYELVADILNALLPHQPDKPTTADGLKQWRHRELKRAQSKKQV